MIKYPHDKRINLHTKGTIMLAQREETYHFERHFPITPHPVPSTPHTLEQKRVSKYVKRRLMVFGVIAGSISASIIYNLYSTSIELQQKQQQHAELRSQLKTLNHEEKELNQEIINLNNDEYLAQIARKEYYFSKEGEVLFQMGKSK